MMIGDNPNNIFLKLELCGPKKDQAVIEIRVIVKQMYTNLKIIGIQRMTASPSIPESFNQACWIPNTVKGAIRVIVAKAAENNPYPEVNIYRYVIKINKWISVEENLYRKAELKYLLIKIKIVN